jgi:hypothetical protein
MNRTAINRKANIEIVKQAKAKNINYCEIRLEGCLGSFALQRVHRHKRRWYYSRPDALLWHFKQWLIGCHNCHERIENDKELTEKIFLRERGEE